MYLKFYGLDKHPFSIAPDPNFFYGSDVHKEGFAHLRYGLIQKKGFVLITGDVGTGKTTLLHLLLRNIPKYTQTAFISNPKLTTNEFFYLISRAFNLGETPDKAQFLVKLGSFLQEAKKNQENVILIVDEAHCLTEELLEEIRLLSNLETPEGKLMNIILVGQPEIKEILKRDSMRALNQRITLRYHLRPLSETETCRYLEVRLMKAGAKDANIFTPRAQKAIFGYSGGIPRVINILADKAMLTGFVKEAPKIDDDIIRECAEEMDLAVQGREKDQGILSKKGREGTKASFTVFFKILAVSGILLLMAIFLWLLMGNNLSEHFSAIEQLLN
jgi:general secretion pathway protein A